MWLLFAFMSAALLGCHDTAKKKSLDGNAAHGVVLTRKEFLSYSSPLR